MDVPCLAICRYSLTGSAPLDRDDGSRNSAGSTLRTSTARLAGYRTRRDAYNPVIREDAIDVDDHQNGGGGWPQA